MGDESTFGILTELLNTSFERRIHDSPSNSYMLAKRRYDASKGNELHEREARTELDICEIRTKIHYLRHLGNLVVAAWLAELVKAGKLDSKTAAPLIEKVVSPISKFQDIIELYLYASDFTAHESPLGYDWWDHVQRIPGRSYTVGGSAFDRWIEPFWVVTALRTASKLGSPKIRIKGLELLPSFREYDYEKLKARIESIIKEESYYSWLTERTTLEKGKDAVLEALCEIKEDQKARDLNKLVSEPISEIKKNDFEAECLKGYLKSRVLFNLVSELRTTATSKDVNKWFDYTERSKVEKKERFVEDWHIGFGGDEVLGNWLGQEETTRFTKQLEDNLKTVGIVENFQVLNPKLKNSANDMRRAGFKPRIILVPEDYRYQAAFTSIPQWQRNSPYMKEGLPTWVSTIDDMDVFIWPDRLGASIAIMDIDGFLGLEEDSTGKSAPFQVKLEEISKEQVQKWLKDEEEKKQEEKGWHKELENCGGNIDALVKTYLIVKMTVKARLGIRNPDAGIKLDLDKKTMGVVCDKRRKVCHLPNCPLVKNISKAQRTIEVTAGLAWRKFGYNPCDECSPFFGKNY